MAVGQTPSQTVGPFFRPSLVRAGSENLVREATRGERVTIEGRVLDGDGAPVPDAMIEIWQANAEGRYDHPEDDQEKLIDSAFHGFGRAATDERGAFRFETIKPGPVTGLDGRVQAPHINVAIFTRGLLRHLATRIYFPDDPRNTSDAVLQSVPTARRSTMIAKQSAARVFVFDIVLQGKDETVFLDV